MVASSRLLFAVARDGVLSLSSWIGRVDSHRQPRNALTVMFVFAAILLCSIIPSQVAFTSLISAGGVPTIAAYGLIGLLRFTFTPHSFKSSYFYLGCWARPMYVSTVLFNGLVFVVRSSPRPSMFCIITQGLGEGLDRAIFLPGDSQHVQLCVHDLWFCVDFCSPLLVLHTSEQVAAPGTDRAGLAHRRGSPRRFFRAQCEPI